MHRLRRHRLSVDSACIENARISTRGRLDALLYNTLNLQAPLIVLPKGGAVSDSEMDSSEKPAIHRKKNKKRRLRSLEDILTG